MCGKMCGAHKVALVLLLIGGLNLGAVGLFQRDLVMMIFGSWPMLVRVIYVLVGVSALMTLAAGKCCMGKKEGMEGNGSCCEGGKK